MRRGRRGDAGGRTGDRGGEDEGERKRRGEGNGGGEEEEERRREIPDSLAAEAFGGTKKPGHQTLMGGARSGRC